MNIETIAQICYESNRVICKANGDDPQVSWDDAEQWQRDSAAKGVQALVDNPDMPPSAQHETWMADKLSDGWRHGDVKDADAKTHPCIVDYDQLPPEQRIKDHVFQAVARGLLAVPEKL